MATCSAAAEAKADMAPLSKNALKKQAQMQYKQQMKAMHHSKAHSSMRNDAQRLRARLDQDVATAVPDSALYSHLPHVTANELFAAVGDEAVERSAFFRRPPYSWRSSVISRSVPAERVINAAPNTLDISDEPNGALSNEPSTADHSADSRACRIIDQFLWRAHKYNQKYASQELSLLYQLYRLGGAQCDLVVDIGAGNANLSCLIALVLDVPVCALCQPRVCARTAALSGSTAPPLLSSSRPLPPSLYHYRLVHVLLHIRTDGRDGFRPVQVICVEMETPREELRGEKQLPPSMLARGAVTRVQSLIQVRPQCHTHPARVPV